MAVPSIKKYIFCKEDCILKRIRFIGCGLLCPVLICLQAVRYRAFLLQKEANSISMILEMHRLKNFAGNKPLKGGKQMELLEQCQKWNEAQEFHKIIDALEDIEEEERTPEMDSELARAYENQADLSQPEGRMMVKRALALLAPHEDHFKEDHCWNFRMGVAYYYLDEEGPAVHYFEQALEARPGDPDTQKLIEDCQHRLALPRFEKNFRERTQQAWLAFEKIEAELRSIMDTDAKQQRKDELIEKCSTALEIAFSEPAFELGFNGEKYELILSAEGNRPQLFPLVYFQQHAPAALLKHWNIWVGRQPSTGFVLKLNQYEVAEEDVQVWAEKTDDNGVSLTLYCEKLRSLAEENIDQVFWLLSALTDQVLGEVASIALIQHIDLPEEPKAEPGASLSELPQILQEMGLTNNNDAASYLENSYLGYELDPVEDPDADWRLDVFAGVTRLPVLINDYMSVQSDTMDEYHRNGIVAGFIVYPTDGFTGEERAKNMLDFRDALQEAIEQKAGKDAVTFLGGASGIYCGYLDFIAWDLFAVLNAAQKFFEQSALPWAHFHVFRRDVGGVPLMDEE